MLLRSLLHFLLLPNQQQQRTTATATRPAPLNLSRRWRWPAKLDPSHRFKSFKRRRSDDQAFLHILFLFVSLPSFHFPPPSFFPFPVIKCLFFDCESTEIKLNE